MKGSVPFVPLIREIVSIYNFSARLMGIYGIYRVLLTWRQTPHEPYVSSVYDYGIK
jgi:hypothetical protein